MDLRLLPLALVAGCSNSPATTETVGATSTSASASATPTGTTSGTTGVSGQPTDDASTSPPTSGGVTCPDGVVGADESCDDGNLIDGDGCNNDCIQSGTLLWEYRSGDDGSDVIYSVAPTGDGGVVIGGYHRGDGVSSRWLARFSDELTPGWSTIIAGAGQESITGVSVTADSIYAAGAVFQNNGHDIWVGGFTSDGTLKWDDVSGDSGEDYASDVALTEQGDIVVSGLAFIDGTNNMWLRRYSSAGKAAWTTTWPLATSAKVYPLGPAVISLPKSVMMGFSTFKPDNTSPDFLIEFPIDGGDPIWQLEIPGTSGNMFGLASVAGGDVLTASSQLFESLTVRRVTSEGSVSWSSTDCVGSIGRSVAVDSNGDIVVIGDGPGKVGRNIRVCKLGPDGSLKWGKDVDGEVGDDLGYSIAVDAKNRVVAGGGLLVAQGQFDGWLAVYAP